MKDHHLHTDEAQKAKDLAALDRQLRDKAVSLDDYLDENEWKQYLDSGNAGRNNDIPGDSYRPVYNASVRKTRRAQLLYKGVGVILLLCICGGAFFFLANNHQPAPSLAFDHTNTTAGPQRIQLPDGSAVVLQPKSELHYAGDYNVTARDIQLTGDAEFQVFKDDSRPLTVYCRDIAVTALGTRFRLAGHAPQVFVHLYEGKVRVRDTASMATPVYPAPGESVAYLSAEKRFIPVDIDGLPLKPVALNVTKPGIKVKKLPEPVRSSTYLSFENTSLGEVFDYLAEHYKVEIRYPTDAAIFSNTFVSVDARLPVGKILENICLANRLKVKAVSETVYIISK